MLSEKNTICTNDMKSGQLRQTVGQETFDSSIDQIVPVTRLTDVYVVGWDEDFVAWI